MTAISVPSTAEIVALVRDAPATVSARYAEASANNEKNTNATLASRRRDRTSDGSVVTVPRLVPARSRQAMRELGAATRAHTGTETTVKGAVAEVSVWVRFCIDDLAGEEALASVPEARERFESVMSPVEWFQDGWATTLIRPASNHGEARATVAALAQAVGAWAGLPHAVLSSSRQWSSDQWQEGRMTVSSLSSSTLIQIGVVQAEEE